ncbi:purine-nucleoside phosphorylase [Tessaracoccus lapidicaptus]|uniref:Purine nucleoside phosphorylase n=1 Tax=Tessaracoccus lapidicaptus TaxID=1427523 RepID=A0A1C0AQ21_9ACTN|nr:MULTISPECIES: purine-nucleoside phosphorylase [Tessaracoccus]AQX15170.1 purine-nucleoside phosphorylase [Tessaracoccus sp. T2.5-30]OCL36518.1 purine-nucleoside phosphorylase [Tessaracoccus lapidicaptus]VEP39395.1 Purine nucleoside phosphorylase [Tessaracoccus lapidicaptus]
MTEPFALAAEAADFLRSRFDVDRIDLALVLGSGWSSGADRLGEPLGDVELAVVPGFSTPVVSGHGGHLLLSRTPAGKVAATFTGRTHYYEGRGVAPVVHGVRTAAAWGAGTLVLTNGCGGLNPAWAPGTVVLLADHINLTGDTPLLGATFIDMSEAYSRRLRDLAHRVDTALPEGVYVQFRGPQYETPAEVRMAGILGGDLVGMSTTLETIAAREAGMEVLGLSLVTNAAAGLSESALNHAEVLQAGRDAGPRLAALLAGIVGEL